jgi:recombination protein RecT
MTTAVAPINEVRSAITKMAPEFKAALPAHVTVERFQRVTMTAIQNTPDLLNADRRSLYNAAMRAAQAGLLPDGREAAIVTFSGKAQFMPMVAGIMKQVRNSGEISTWSVQAVYENDTFDYCLGDDEHITHKPALRGRGAIIGAYSIVTMKDGEKSREFMDVDQIEAIRKRSRSGNAGPWKTDFDEMAKKTVVRRHSKRLPMSTDLDDLLRSDDDQFMPTEAPAAATQEPATPPADKPKGRASRLAGVAAQAPQETIDDDGVIEGEAIEHEPAGESEDHDSPI